METILIIYSIQHDVHTFSFVLTSPAVEPLASSINHCSFRCYSKIQEETITDQKDVIHGDILHL